MASLICLAASFLFFRIVGLEWGYFADWHHALRAALGAMFLLTASAQWVSATGVAEIAIAIGLQLPRLAPWTAAIAVVMLCCLFPANLRAARERLTIDHKPVLPAVPRFLIQLVFIAAVIGSVWPRQ